MTRNVVDLPEPDGPSRAKNSRGSISRSMPFSASKLPNFLRIPLSETRPSSPLIGGLLP